MIGTLSFTDTNAAIGLKVRKRAAGPEAELVETFGELIIPQLRSRHDDIALFFEPSLESGFPDVVICVYDPRRFDGWSPLRSHLKVQDLKLLHHLHTVGRVSVEAAAVQLGVNRQLMLRSLENLHDAGLIRPIGKQWRPLSVKRTFGIRRLVAVEAKMGGWTDVFRQACTNRWFASESYALSPVRRPSAKVLQRSEQLGIGIYTCAHREVIEVRPSEKSPLPSCYASWLFNEWIGRLLTGPSSTEGGPHVSA